VSRSLIRLSRSIQPALLSILSGVGLGAFSLHLASAADVRGQLVLGSAREPPAAKPPRAAYNWELENGVKEVAPTRVVAQRELGVVLLGAGTPKAGDALDVTLSGGALLPSTLVVRAGTTVRIRNEDEIGHELYAVGLDGFSAEATSPNGVRSVHLTKVGNWPLLDHLAVHSRAHLHVLDNLVASAKIDASGSYSFSDVPAGKYTLKVFRGANELVSKDVEVLATDKSLTVDPLTLGTDKSGP
jgi:plastocyanin